jgi:hypothetical protein
MIEYKVLSSYDIESPVIPSKVIIMEVTLSQESLKKYKMLDNRLRKNQDNELVRDLMSDCGLSYSNDVLGITNWDDLHYALVQLNRLIGDL